MKVHAIKTGSVRVKTAQTEARGGDLASKLAIFADPQWTDWLPTFAFAIEHEEGVIVVDTGQAVHLLEAQRQSFHPYFRWEVGFQIEPEEEVGPQLRALGIGAHDVKQVVLTHLHIDHDGGLAHFPHSEILAAGGEIDRAKGLMGTIQGYLPQRWPSWFSPVRVDLSDGPFGPFAASKRLTKAGDVIVVATPGHTADHLSVVVEDGDRTIFIAGDTSYSEALMLAGKVDGVSPHQNISSATLSGIRLLGQQRSLVYLPTHDPDSGVRLTARQAVDPSQYLNG